MAQRRWQVPALIHKFGVQNLADLAWYVVTFIALGLLFERTAAVSSMFMWPQHIVPILAERAPPGMPSLYDVRYRYGVYDLAMVSFCSLAFFVFHNALQNSVLDCVVRRLQLPRARQRLFNEAGQLGVFYLVSCVNGFKVLLAEGCLAEPARLWRAPPAHMTYHTKVFYVLQISYLCQALVQFYLQRMPMQDLHRRLVYVGLYLFHNVAAYLVHVHHLGILLLTMHYVVELLTQVRNLVNLGDDRPPQGVSLWAVAFILGRLGTLVVSVLTMGLHLAQGQTQDPGAATSNENMRAAKIAMFVNSCTIQACVTWGLFIAQLERWREGDAAPPAPAARKKQAKVRLSREASENAVGASRSHHVRRRRKDRSP